jgi:hypothetical protein
MTRHFAILALLAVVALAACGTPAPHPKCAERIELANTYALRIDVYYDNGAPWNEQAYQRYKAQVGHIRALGCDYTERTWEVR